MDASANDLRGCRALLVIGVSLQNGVPDAHLRCGVGDQTEKREAALLAIDGVLTGREGHIAAGTSAALPDRVFGEPETLSGPPVKCNSAGHASLPPGLPLSFGVIFTAMLSLAILLIRGYRGSFAARRARNA